MTASPDPARRPRVRALTVSLALNLFLAAALAGLWAGGEGASPWAAREAGADGVEYSLAAFVRDLPEGARERMVQALDGRQAEVSERIDALMRARARVAAALTAEPHDPDAVRRAFGQLRETTRDMQATVQGIVGEVTAGLSPADRARLARGIFTAVPAGREDRVSLDEIPLL